MTVRESPGSRLIGLQGIGLPARPIERQHEVTPESFPEGMVDDQGFQFREKLGMQSEGKLRLQPVLDHIQPKILQPGRLGQHPRIAG
jgi:hypothetical protein